MFRDVIGEWPKNGRFLLTSCDEIYFNAYFPRFYKTFTEYWKLPIHVHIINASPISLERLNDLKVTYTSCTTDAKVLKWPYSYPTYCQAQRFILAGFNLQEGQSVTIADVDCYALREPTIAQQKYLASGMAFTQYNGRLMATFCNWHHSQRRLVMKAAERMQQLIEGTDTIGVDQLVLKEKFYRLPYNNLKHGRWIRHFDVKTDEDRRQHEQCLIYHEKGTRGKTKGVKVGWTDL